MKVIKTTNAPGAVGPYSQASIPSAISPVAGSKAI